MNSPSRGSCLHEPIHVVGVCLTYKAMGTNTQQRGRIWLHLVSFFRNMQRHKEEKKLTFMLLPILRLCGKKYSKKIGGISRKLCQR
jgi:hypothetical protein